MQTLAKQYIEYVADKAREVLRTEGIVLQKPFLTQENSSRVIEALGGRLYFVPKEQWDSDWGDGYIKVNGNDDDEQNFDLKVNKDKFSPERNIFTIAHELGHLFLHMKYGTPEWATAQVEFKDAFWHRKGISSTVENEANYFAVCFLMPEMEFSQVWNEQMTSDNVAEQFNVSKAAANARARSLALPPQNPHRI
jgi:Zn-dependent peptidase ImmA (M78 family)